jgi:hypothetical protein
MVFRLFHFTGTNTREETIMSFGFRGRIFPVLVVAALGSLLAADRVQAQGRCMRGQQAGQASMRSLSYGLPYQNAFATQAYAQPYALQQYVLQQNALQQYALQQYALQQYALQAQLGALQQNAYLGQLNSFLTDDALPQQNVQLTPSQLRKARQQQAALKKKIKEIQPEDD